MKANLLRGTTVIGPLRNLKVTEGQVTYARVPVLGGELPPVPVRKESDTFTAEIAGPFTLDDPTTPLYAADPESGATLAQLHVRNSTVTGGRTFLSGVWQGS